MADLLGCALIGWHISLPAAGWAHTHTNVCAARRENKERANDVSPQSRLHDAHQAIPSRNCQYNAAAPLPDRRLICSPCPEKIKYDGVQRRKMFLKAKPLNCVCRPRNTHTQADRNNKVNCLVCDHGVVTILLVSLH